MRERDSHSTPAAIVSVTKLDVVSPDQSFSNLPKKNHHISFSSPFLRIKVKQIQSLPVVKIFKILVSIPHDLWLIIGDRHTNFEDSMLSGHLKLLHFFETPCTIRVFFLLHDFIRTTKKFNSLSNPVTFLRS